MRMLSLNEDNVQKVLKVKEYADDPRHYYFVDKGGKTFQKPPGDNPAHVAQLDTFRCVFSITKADGTTWRHLSISVPSTGYPNPFAAFTIAQMFGFTGWDGKNSEFPDGWLGKVNKEEHCIVLAQELSPSIVEIDGALGDV
jgi:hypothetical protein